MQHPIGSPQQFCLRWNNYQSNLTSVFDQLLQSEAFVDVTLACDGHSVKAHKMVLSACSPYFQSLFFDNPCRHPIVILKDIKWPELKAVVEFMYRGEINVSQEQIGPLLKVAEALKIRGLADVNGDSDSPPTAANSASGGASAPSSNASSSSSEAGPSGGKKSGGGGGMGGGADSVVGGGGGGGGGGRSAPPFPWGLPPHFGDLDCGMGYGGDPLSPGALPPPLHPLLMHPAAAAAAAAQGANARKRRRRVSGGERGGMGAGSPEEVVAAQQAAAAAAAGSIGNGGGGGGMGGLGSGGGGGGSGSNGGDVGSAAEALVDAAVEMVGGNGPGGMSPPQQPPSTPEQQMTPGSHGHGTPSLPPPPPPPPPPPSLSALSALGPQPEEMEIKPGIAEMIREEERAKLLETSHAWLGASTSSITDNLGGSLESNYHLQRPLLNSFITSSLDQSLNKCDRRHITNSYQYQLQSMWQKCWNTNQSLVHNLRFRERGPLKSWRPETMAEAIFSVLKEGLSLSQSARKYDIPYPTFVLYANRVHNMLGPSIDGGSDLRPKGRGRPQRILLGNWPDDHIRGVIRAVVFRDTTHVKDETHLSYPPRIQNYQLPPPNVPSSNGPEPGTLSVAAAAAVAAVAQGLRQQLCASAMGGPQALPPPPPPPVAPQASPPPQQQQQPDPTAGMAALANSLGSLGGGLGGLVGNSIGGIGGIGVSGMTYKPGATYATPRPENLFQEDIDEIVKSPLQQHGSGGSGVGVDDRVMSREPPPELQPVQVKMEQLAAEGHNE